MDALYLFCAVVVSPQREENKPIRWRNEGGYDLGLVLESYVCISFYIMSWIIANFYFCSYDQSILFQKSSDFPKWF